MAAVVVVRMRRLGRRGAPIHALVAADARAPRDGRFLEDLGRYDPGAPPGKELANVRVDAVRAWLARGAALSDSARTLLARNGIAP